MYFFKPPSDRTHAVKELFPSGIVPEGNNEDEPSNPMNGADSSPNPGDSLDWLEGATAGGAGAGAGGRARRGSREDSLGMASSGGRARLGSRDDIMSGLGNSMRKKRAFWGRGTHPELVLVKDGEGRRIERGTMEALVHECVFGTTFRLDAQEPESASPSAQGDNELRERDEENDTEAETISANTSASAAAATGARLKREQAWHDFASSILLSLPSLSPSQAKVEAEFIRCCQNLTAGAPEGQLEREKGRVEWLAGEYLRLHGAPVDGRGWEEFRRETLPDSVVAVPRPLGQGRTQAGGAGDASSLPSSSSMQVMDFSP
jgi:GTPase-activating protein BEM2